MTEQPLKYQKEKDVFRCLLCGYLTPKLSTIKDHCYTRKKSCDKKTELKCDKCLKIFSQKSTFTDHLNRKTSCIKNLNAPCNKKSDEEKNIQEIVYTFYTPSHKKAQQKYRTEHRDKYNEYSRKYFKERYDNDPEFRKAILEKNRERNKKKHLKVL